MLDTRPAQPRTATARRRPVVALLFAVYLVLLVWIVMWKLHLPFIGRDDMRGVKLVPFVAADGFGASAPYEVVVNLLLFVPVGMFLGLLSRRPSLGKVVVIAGSMSLVLEAAQYVTAVGSPDVTDLIVNTAGAVLGYGVFRLARGGRVVVGLCAAVTAGLLAASAVYVATLPRLPEPGSGDHGVRILIP